VGWHRSPLGGRTRHLHDVVIEEGEGRASDDAAARPGAAWRGLCRRSAGSRAATAVSVCIRVHPWFISGGRVRLREVSGAAWGRFGAGKRRLVVSCRDSMRWSDVWPAGGWLFPRRMAFYSCRGRFDGGGSGLYWCSGHFDGSGWASGAVAGHSTEGEMAFGPQNASSTGAESGLGARRWPGAPGIGLECASPKLVPPVESELGSSIVVAGREA